MTKHDTPEGVWIVQTSDANRSGNTPERITAASWYDDGEGWVNFVGADDNTVCSFIRSHVVSIRRADVNSDRRAAQRLLRVADALDTPMSQIHPVEQKYADEFFKYADRNSPGLSKTLREIAAWLAKP